MPPDKSGEQSGLANLSLEAELESYVFNSVLVVVDLHLVGHTLVSNGK
jgi:hypothetical protein